MKYQNGDIVTSQGVVPQRGTVVEDSIPGLPGFVLVSWEDGQTVEELTADIDFVKRAFLNGNLTIERV